VKTKSSLSMKDRIIDESIRLFLKTGFKGTSIQHITDTVGITKGAFYWYFKSKDELLETIIEKYDRDNLERLYAHMKTMEGTFLTKFKEYHKFINEYARDHGEFCVLFVTLAAEMAGGKTTAERKIKSVYKKYHTFISSLLTAGKKEGLFDQTFDVSLNAHIIIAIHNGILLQWYMNRSEMPGPMLARTYRNIILYGIVMK